MEYINLLDGELLIKVCGLGFLTIIIMAVIEAVYHTEKMGEDAE